MPTDEKGAAVQGPITPELLAAAFIAANKDEFIWELDEDFWTLDGSFSFRAVADHLNRAIASTARASNEED